MEKPSLDTAKAGAIRFNTDSSQMEIYDGNQWTGVLSTSPEQQTGGTRAMMLSGAYPVNTDIQIFNIATTGNAVDSGFDFGTSRYLGGAASDRTRGVYFGGYSPSAEIRFNSIPSVGSTSDFGDLTSARFGATGVSNGTRGISLGGSGPTGGSINAGMNNIEYVTIQHLGTGQDFGDLTEAGYNQTCSMSSPTRGFVGSGIYLSPSATQQDSIEFVTISTQGTAADFGDAINSPRALGALASPTRGIVAGGTPDASIELFKASI